MKIQLISRGSKGYQGQIKTAQIVIHHNGRSYTKHLWQVSGNQYKDKAGSTYTIA